MKREYTKPEIAIQIFSTEDIITTSGGTNEPQTVMSIDDDNITVINGDIFNS